MRSRTELVTTTFDLDSDEEDYSPEDDDSEEDWRPNKKRQQKQPRANGSGAGGSDSGGGGSGRKRKGAAAASAAKNKRRAIVPKVSDEDFEDFDDDDDQDSDLSDGDFENVVPSTSTAKRAPNLPPKKQFAKLTQLELLLKKQDLLDKDWLQNRRLCLWRKDEQTNLLQKYLRVKTTEDSAKPQDQQELIFTSSSVYSSWDEQQIGDFIDVKVNCLDPNNRRIQLNDIEAIKKLSVELQAETANESNSNPSPSAEIDDEKDDEKSDDKGDPEADDGDDDEEDDEDQDEDDDNDEADDDEP